MLNIIKHYGCTTNTMDIDRLLKLAAVSPKSTETLTESKIINMMTELQLDKFDYNHRLSNSGAMFFEDCFKKFGSSSKAVFVVFDVNTNKPVHIMAKNGNRSSYIDSRGHYKKTTVQEAIDQVRYVLINKGLTVQLLCEK